MTIETMLKCHEDFKEKKLSISEEDMLDRLNLREDMLTESSNIKSKVIEGKIEMDKEKAKRVLELKNVTDDKGKGLTEKAIDGNIKQEFADKELELATQKAVAELLVDKADSIIEYINVIKIHKKISY